MGATTKGRGRTVSLDAIAAKCDGAMDFLRELAAPHERQGDYADLVAGMARSLPDEHAEVFTLHWGNGLGIPEIAARLGRPAREVADMLAEAQGWVRESTEARRLRGEAACRAARERAEAGDKAAPRPPCAGCGGKARTARDGRGLCPACRDRADRDADKANPREAADEESMSVAPCTDCGTDRGIYRDEGGRCWGCHERQRRGARAAESGEIPPATPCKECGTTGGYVLPRGIAHSRIKGLCQGCYNRRRKNRKRRHDRAASPRPGAASPAATPEAAPAPPPLEPIVPGASPAELLRALADPRLPRVLGALAELMEALR